MSPNPPLHPSPEEEHPLPGAADAGPVSGAGEKGIPAAAAEHLVAEAGETLAREGEERRSGSHLSTRRRRELFEQYEEVRLQTFLLYPDPRSDFSALVMEAFTRAFQELPAEVSDSDAYEKVMDVAAQLASDDRDYFDQRRGYSAVHCPSLVDLFGIAAHDEFHEWLTVVDGLEAPVKAVYHLRAVYGMTNKEASEVLGCHESWTSKLYGRAISRLTSAGVSVEELEQCFFNVEIKRR